MKKRELHPFFFAFFSFLLLLQVLLFWRAKGDAFRGLVDFSSFYSAAWMVRNGMGHQLYNPVTQARVQNLLYSQASTRNGLLPYIHPPFEALLYLPLTCVSYRAAYAIWVVINIFVLLMAMVLLSPFMRELKSLWSPLPHLLYLGFFPAFIGLLQGQDSILLLLVFSLVFVNLKAKHEFAGGFVLALGLFKFQYALPFLVPFLLWRRWKVVGGFAVSTGILFLFSFAVAGFHGTLSYATFLLNLSKGSSSYHIQNPLGILSNTMPNVRGAIEMLGAGLLQPGIQRAIIVLLSCAALIWAAAKWRLRQALPERAFDLGYGLALVISVMISYHLQLHDMTLLLIPFVLVMDHVLKERGPAGRRRILMFGIIIALFFFSPLYLWLIQRALLYLLFIPILLFALMLSREIGLFGIAGDIPASEKPPDQVSKLT